MSVSVLLSSLLILYFLPISANAAPNTSKRFSSIYSGRIIVDNKSKEPYYVNPDDLGRVYLGEAEEALSILLSLSVGISNKDFKKIPLEKEKRVGNQKLLNRLSGRVIVKVQDKRKAYYINPVTRKASPLLTSEDAEKLINNAPKLGKRMLERIALSEYNPLLEEGSDNDTDEDGITDFDEISSGTSPFKVEPERTNRSMPIAKDTSPVAPFSTSTPITTTPYYPTPNTTPPSTTTSTTTPPTGIPDLIATLPYLITGSTNRVVTLAGAVMPLSPSVYLKLYEWDYTTDGVYDYTSTWQGTVDQLYSTAGEYTATFRVTDNLGRQSKASMKVQISAPSVIYVPPATSTTTSTSTTPIITSPSSQPVTSTTTTATTTPSTPPPPAPTITVTSPKGGEEWVQGSTYNITWTSSGDVQNVQIILQVAILYQWSQDSVLATVANSGTWSWTIPTGRTFSSGPVYQIKVINIANQNILGASYANFTIAPLPIAGPDTALIGHWKFDGNGNNEISGSPSAAIVGAASFNADGGKLGGYAYIPSANDSVRIPYNSAFDLPNAFTIEFWFRQRADRSFLQALVYKGNGMNNYNFRVFRQLWNEYNYGPIITGYTSNTTGWWTQTSNPNQPTHNVWHHVAFVKDSTWRAYYIDGVLIHSDTDSPVAKTPATDIIIGDSAVDTDIDDLKIYNRALRGSEITQESSR